MSQASSRKIAAGYVLYRRIGCSWGQRRAQISGRWRDCILIARTVERLEGITEIRATGAEQRHQQKNLDAGLTNDSFISSGHGGGDLRSP
jgi:hypothetical protein